MGALLVDGKEVNISSLFYPVFPSMASLPPVGLTSTLKLEPQLQKLSSPFPPSEKYQNPSISYRRARVNTPLDGNSEPLRALEVIKDGKGIEPSCYIPLLQQCIDNSSVSETRIVHSHLIKTGTHEVISVMITLVNVYAQCGEMASARKVFDSLPRKNVGAWTMLMAGYVQNSQPETGLDVFREMLDSGSSPSNLILAVALKACSSLNSIGLGRQFHAFIVKYQLDYDNSVGNALSSLYSKFGKLVSAVKTFRKIEEKNVISWTAMISACGENGREQMGLKIFVEMLVDDVKPNELTLASVLSLCNATMSLGPGKQVHSWCIKLGHMSNMRVSNSVMYLYIKCGCIDEARKLFDGKESISMVTWNAMITGHAQAMNLAKDHHSAHQTGVEALDIYLNLNHFGIAPDHFTLSSILTVCSKLVAIEPGEQIHAQIVKSGYLFDVVVGTAVVNMYSKCGSIEGARKAFLEMRARSLISWTSMINSFAQHGYTQQALQLFEDMRLAGVRPNQITFVGVLAACSRAGMVEEALEYFEMMQKEYRIKPLRDHYGCLIDMFVRLGKLDEAFDTVKKMESMELDPNESIWFLLLAGCRNHGKEELGCYAAERLLSLEPTDIETYAILLDMYVSAERWEEVSKVRKLMKDEKVRKLKDWSRISLNGKFYSFRTSRWLHSGNEEIYKLLDELFDKANGLGYELQENREEIDGDDNDEDDEGSESMVPSAVYHSEKLAVAFGLLNTPKNAPIRVTKSISMCKDCHNFFKAISLITNRDITIRDSKKLRRFVKGQYSSTEFGDFG